MMRWLNTLPGHTYSNEGMEEIGTVTKPDCNEEESTPVEDSVATAASVETTS